MAATAGLGVLLETTAAAQQQQQLVRPAASPPARTPPAAQIISKATLHNAATTTTAKKDTPSVFFSCSSYASSRARPSVPPARAATAACSFLQRCFRCHRELADGRDIYIYRGDRAFCSEECRCRHIILVEDDDCTWVAAADRSRQQPVAGGLS